MECSNASNCIKGEFCNFDLYVSGFCETCPEAHNSCDAQDFLFELGNEECKNRCGGGDNKAEGMYTMYTIGELSSVTDHCTHQISQKISFV